MINIIEDLRKIMHRIEDLDDPTSQESYRDLIGDAHFSIEECINALNIASKPAKANYIRLTPEKECRELLKKSQTRKPDTDGDR